jgi:multidrug efflux pump subunit AcrB
MWLVLTAMRRPITILVAVVAVALASVMAIRQMKVDIFPQLGAPAIYVAQPYGGMDPSQMEGYLRTTTSITSSTSPASSTLSPRTSRASRS